MALVPHGGLPLSRDSAIGMEIGLLVSHFTLDQIWNVGNRYLDIREQYHPVEDDATLFKICNHVYLLNKSLDVVTLVDKEGRWTIERSPFNDRGDTAIVMERKKNILSVGVLPGIVVQVTRSATCCISL